jgi:radical SAM superfamily enzyme YgiQ (UPF0313 family)
MKIAFIRPSIFARPSKDAMAPLVFAIVKALTPKEFELVFYDEKIEEIPAHLDADAVAMSVETFCAKRAYKLAQKYGRMGKKVIMGGLHPTMMPDEALEVCDSVVLGELEGVWEQVLNDLKNNTLKKQYQSANWADLSAVKYDYSALEGKKYNPVGLVQFSRGCKYSCEFCSVCTFFKNTVRTKSIEATVQEVKQKREKFIFFIDDNLFSDETKARELFEHLTPLKKKWMCQMSIDAAKNSDLLKLMKKAGCMMVGIGFESLNIENLKQMKKSANIKHNDYEEIIKNIHECSIMLYGTFVVGYDLDTKNTASQLADFALKHKFAMANFNPLVPMPGTKLYERLEKEGRLTYKKWWLDDNYSYGNALLKPKNMSENELMESCKAARYRFNSCGSIFRRLLNFKANCKSPANTFFFLLSNLISRAEIHSKQGKKLGGEG